MREGLANTALLSVLTPTLTLLICIAFSWIVLRSRIPGRGVFDAIAFLPHAVPNIVFGLGALLLALYVVGAVIPLFGTIWLFFIAFTAHRFPFAFMFMRNSVKQLSSEMEEAARMSGASWGRTIVDISAPLLKAGILAAWMMVFAVTLRELSMAILLYVPGTETLPVAIYSFIDNGTFEIAAAVSVLLILMSIAAMLALRWLTGKAQMEL